MRIENDVGYTILLFLVQLGLATFFFLFLFSQITQTRPRERETNFCNLTWLITAQSKQRKHFTCVHLLLCFALPWLALKIFLDRMMFIFNMWFLLFFRTHSILFFLRFTTADCRDYWHLQLKRQKKKSFFVQIKKKFQVIFFHQFFFSSSCFVLCWWYNEDITMNF